MVQMETVTVKADADQRVAMAKVINYVLSCRRSNTPEWMDGLVEVINEYAKEVGEGDRVATLRDGLQVITQQDIEETRPDV